MRLSVAALLTFISTAAFAAIVASTVPSAINPNAVPSSFRATAISTLNSIISSLGAGAIAETQLAQPTGTNEGLFAHRIARAEYDVATDLGTVAAHGLGVTLPAKAIITRSWIEIKTQFVDAGAGTVAISCEDANNIKTATDITGSAAGALIEGESTGAASAFKTSIAAACEITATVATAAQTAGKLTVWVEYVVGQ